MDMDCSRGDIITKKLEQHEQTITQLLTIIAATNRKLNELNLKQTAMEQNIHHNSCSLRNNLAEVGFPLPSQVASNQ